jgi:hypothetical protein
MIEYALFLLGMIVGGGIMAAVNIRSYNKGFNDGRKYTLNSVYGKRTMLDYMRQQRDD